MLFKGSVANKNALPLSPSEGDLYAISGRLCFFERKNGVWIRKSVFGFIFDNLN